jgi:hypothetical protein
MIAAVVLCGAPQLVRAQTTRPTTTFSTVDLSTPRGTLRSLNSAIREGDVDAMRRIFLASTPAEKKMADADAQMAAALADLRESAIKAFDAEHASILCGDVAVGSAQSLARIEAAAISISGDTATVKYGGEKPGPPFVLKSVNGEWKVPVSQLGQPVDPAALDQRLGDLAVQRNVVREVAEMIRAGKFGNAEQAREAWQTRILQAATSKPAVRSKDPQK